MARANWLKRETIEQHSVDMRQFIDFRESTLPNGMRVIEAYNSSGLTFTILPDRGMDIYTAHYNGMPLTWISQGAPFLPDNGQNWLQQFNGGLLTTCGLTHVGPPETDAKSGETRDLHGQYTRLRAFDTSIKRGWSAANYEMKLTAQLAQSRLFGEQLAFSRRYNWKLGEARINIIDFVTNLSDKPVPLMILYHCNVGFPIVREGTELLVASDVYSRDSAAKAGVQAWNQYSKAQKDYAEQVFFHHAKTDPIGQAHAALLNDDIGLKFSWKTDTLPYFTQWKNVRYRQYVSGIEPGNCIPEGQNQARESGRLFMLQPDEVASFSLTISILENPKQISDFRKQVELLDRNSPSVSTCDLRGYEKYLKPVSEPDESFDTQPMEPIDLREEVQDDSLEAMESNQDIAD